MIIKQIFDDLKSVSKPIAKILKKGKDFKVVAIGFNKDMVLEDHKTLVPAKLVVLQGKVIYKEGDKFVMMSQYDEVPIPANVIHRVTGLEDGSLCLVIMGE